jgi:hypothetical protein
MADDKAKRTSESTITRIVTVEIPPGAIISNDGTTMEIDPSKLAPNARAELEKVFSNDGTTMRIDLSRFAPESRAELDKLPKKERHER